jgi:hypothetical protein
VTAVVQTVTDEWVEREAPRVLLMIRSISLIAIPSIGGFLGYILAGPLELGLSPIIVGFGAGFVLLLGGIVGNQFLLPLVEPIRIRASADGVDLQLGFLEAGPSTLHLPWSQFEGGPRPGRPAGTVLLSYRNPKDRRLRNAMMSRGQYHAILSNPGHPQTWTETVPE